MRPLRSLHADLDGLAPSPFVRLSVAVVLTAAVIGSGIAVGRATATCSIDITHTVPSAPSPSASPSTDVGLAGGAAGDHSEHGAVAAATHVITVLGGDLVLRRDAYRDAVDRLAAPSARVDLLRRADQLVDALDAHTGIVSAAASGVRVTVSTTPLRWHVDAYSGTAAAVRIWSLGLIAADGTVPPTATWAAGVVRLEWTDGAWRLDGVDAVAGPVPRSVQTAAAGAALPSELDVFGRYDDAPAS